VIRSEIIADAAATSKNALAGGDNPTSIGMRVGQNGRETFTRILNAELVAGVGDLIDEHVHVLQT
jgi:hypothetical protein